MIEAGSIVVCYLASPREQVFGLVESLTPAGLVMRGMALASVDDWLRSFDEGEDEGASHGLGLSTTFYPMHRVEKVALDESVAGTVPIHVRFEDRTGQSFLGYAERLAGGA